MTTTLTPTAPSIRRLHLLSVAAALLLPPYPVAASAAVTHYGADVSYPIQHPDVDARKDGSPFGDDRRRFYDELLRTCGDAYGGECSEDDRIEMNLMNPSQMINFTESGHRKIRAPPEIFDPLERFWRDNAGRETVENWSSGDMTVNHWVSPTYMLSLEDEDMVGGGYDIKRRVWEASEVILREWTGQQNLRGCSLYGVRIYREGSVLSPHVDRFPLVTSAIVNVAQDVDEPWPLEVYGRDGMAVNITMEPGDMVLYESHSLIHGRPFPLRGRYMANVFIHFEPTDVRETDGLPVYLAEGASRELINVWEEAVEENAGEGMTEKEEGAGTATATATATATTSEAHRAAATGDVGTLEEIASGDSADDLLHSPDENGWRPLHEAVRGGHTDAVEMLIESGADVNERTNFGEGPSPLGLALSEHGEGHSVVEYLRRAGAVDTGEL